jgi:glycosyltransferase involved in cell wall biosynthesis
MNLLHKTPLVSAILPTYNPGLAIKNAVQSILCQKIDLELIVIDDGSIADVSNLIGSYAKKVKLIRQENRGVAAARNLGIKNSAGSYIAFLDDDDRWTPNALQERLACLEKYPHAAGVLSAPLYKDTKGKMCSKIAIKNLKIGQCKILERWEYCKLQQKSGYFMTQGALIRKEIVEKIGGFDEKLFSSEDQDFLFKIIHDYQIIFLQLPTFIRITAGMTNDPTNFFLIKYSQYQMLNKHIENVNQKWSKKDSKFFWKFRDMAVRQVLKIALKENKHNDVKRYSAELKNLSDPKNIVLKMIGCIDCGKMSIIKKYFSY